MEHIAVLSSSHPSFFPVIQKTKSATPRLWKRRTYRRTHLRCQKISINKRAFGQARILARKTSLAKHSQRITHGILKIGSTGFGEASPEAKAAKHLHNFFTFVAVRIVTAQLQSYNPEAHQELKEFLDKHSLNDGDKFCADLMRESQRHKSIALRILEVRSVYCKKDFEWDNLELLAAKMVDESNTRLMRDYVLETSHVENQE